MQVVEVPEQAPDQPVNVLPSEGVAVRVTFVPDGCSEHEVPQLAPGGSSNTVPDPVPVLETVSEYSG